MIEKIVAYVYIYILLSLESIILYTKNYIR